MLSYFVLKDPFAYATDVFNRYFVMGINYGIPIALMLHSLFILV